MSDIIRDLRLNAHQYAENAIPREPIAIHIDHRTYFLEHLPIPETIVCTIKQDGQEYLIKDNAVFRTNHHNFSDGFSVPEFGSFDLIDQKGYKRQDCHIRDLAYYAMIDYQTGRFHIGWAKPTEIRVSYEYERD